MNNSFTVTKGVQQSDSTLKCKMQWCALSTLKWPYFNENAPPVDTNWLLRHTTMRTISIHTMYNLLQYMILVYAWAH